MSQGSEFDLRRLAKSGLKDFKPYLAALQMTRAQRLADEIDGTHRRTPADEAVDRLLDMLWGEPPPERGYRL